MNGKDTPEVQQCQAFNGHRRAWAVLLLGLCLLASGCAPIGKGPISPQQADRRLAELESQTAAAGIQEIVAVASFGDGQTYLWSWPPGRELSNQHFALASVSKIYTTAAILEAEKSGLLALDSPLNGRGMTPRHLLTHTSGLEFSDGELVEVLPPGLRYHYDNRAFALLVGENRPEWMESVVLERRGLFGTTVQEPGGPLPFGSGGIGATPMDALAFARSWLVRDDAGRADWERAVDAGMANFAPPLVAGWRAEWTNRGSVHRLYHAGAIDGAGAEIGIYPAENVAIAIVARGRYDGPVFERTRRVLERVAEVETPATMHVPDIEPRDLAGEWFCAASGSRIAIAARGDAIVLTGDDGAAAELQRASAREFVSTSNGSDDLARTFELESGRVLEVVAPAETVAGLLWEGGYFERVP